MKESQSITEYALFISAVLVGLLALQVYYHRAVKGNLKAKTDMIGEQFNLKDANYILESKSVSARQTNQSSGITYIDASGNVEKGAMISRIAGSSLDSAFQKDITNAGGLVSSGYQGGEISVNDYKDVTNPAKHGTADMGMLSTTGNVSQDMGM